MDGSGDRRDPARETASLEGALHAANIDSGVVGLFGFWCLFRASPIPSTLYYRGGEVPLC